MGAEASKPGAAREEGWRQEQDWQVVSEGGKNRGGAAGVSGAVGDSEEGYRKVTALVKRLKRLKAKKQGPLEGRFGEKGSFQLGEEIEHNLQGREADHVRDLLEELSAWLEINSRECAAAQQGLDEDAEAMRELSDLLLRRVRETNAAFQGTVEVASTSASVLESLETTKRGIAASMAEYKRLLEAVEAAEKEAGPEPKKLSYFGGTARDRLSSPTTFFSKSPAGGKGKGGTGEPKS